MAAHSLSAPWLTPPVLPVKGSQESWAPTTGPILAARSVRHQHAQGSWASSLDREPPRAGPAPEGAAARAARPPHGRGQTRRPLAPDAGGSVNTQTDTTATTRDAHPGRRPGKNADNRRLSRNRRRDAVENDEYAAFTRRIVRAYSRRVAVWSFSRKAQSLATHRSSLSRHQPMRRLTPSSSSKQSSSRPARPRTAGGAARHAGVPLTS